MTTQGCGFYDKYIASRLVHCACALPNIRAQRAQLVPQAEGVVLEVGIGSGHNLPFYDASKVHRLIGIDPNPTLIAMARKRAAAHDIPVELLPQGAEAMPLEDNLADTAVITYAMCTIPEVAAALSEVRRVLKPGGRLLFVEHGRADRPSVARWQDRLNPLWSALAGGCNLNRNIADLVRHNGFHLERLETYKLPLTPAIVGFHYRGSARPA